MLSRTCQNPHCPTAFLIPTRRFVFVRQRPALWLTEGWPTEAWLSSSVSEELPEPLAAPVSAEGMWRVIADLKDVATRCSGDACDGVGQDLFVSDRDKKAIAVRRLESVASALHDPCASQGEVRSSKVPGHQAVRAFISCWLSRNKQANLPIILRQMLLTCWPNSLGEALAKAVTCWAYREQCSVWRCSWRRVARATACC